MKISLQFFLLLLVSFSASAETGMVYLFHPPESTLDVRYNYHWDILRAALQSTEKKYGDYILRPSVFMTEDRQIRELAKKSGKLSVMIRETSHDFEKKFIPIRIPIDRNLIGYRVLLIDKKNKDLFRNVNSLEDLKKISLGQGAGWGDVEILKSSGFNVATEVYYDKIFEGLLKGEYQAFPRAVTEVMSEIEKRKAKMPDLFVEDSILLYYPLPTYFWFSNTEHGKELAARAQEGMETIMANGTFDKLFQQYYKDDITALKLKKRKIFKIENPNLPGETPFNDKRLWVDLNNI